MQIIKEGAFALAKGLLSYPSLCLYMHVSGRRGGDSVPLLWCLLHPAPQTGFCVWRSSRAPTCPSQGSVLSGNGLSRWMAAGGKMRMDLQGLLKRL